MDHTVKGDDDSGGEQNGEPDDRRPFGPTGPGAVFLGRQHRPKLACASPNGPQVDKVGPRRPRHDRASVAALTAACPGDRLRQEVLDPARNGCVGGVDIAEPRAEVPHFAVDRHDDVRPPACPDDNLHLVVAALQTNANRLGNANRVPIGNDTMRPSRDLVSPGQRSHPRRPPPFVREGTQPPGELVEVDYVFHRHIIERPPLGRITRTAACANACYRAR